MGWDSIPGWFNFHDIYDDMVATAPAQGATIVELGSAFGRSIAYLARRVMDSGKKIRVVSVDLWDKPTWDDGGDSIYDADPRETIRWNGIARDAYRKGGNAFGAFLHCMTKHAPDELRMISVLRCSTQEAADIFRNKILHGVFIDAAHDYDNVRADIDAWRWNVDVDNGGILAGHDYDPVQFPGVVQAVRETWGGGTEGMMSHAPDRFKIRGTSWQVIP